MPTYNFENIETGERFEDLMTISAKEEYLKENPIMIQIHVNSVKLITGKEGSMLKQAGDGWKEVQDRIKSGMPPRLRGNIRGK